MWTAILKKEERNKKLQQKVSVVVRLMKSQVPSLLQRMQCGKYKNCCGDF